MPMMVSLRNVRIESTKGHVVVMEAKVPKFIPDAIVPEAAAKGCAMAEEGDEHFYEDLSNVNVEFQGDVRKSMIYLAVQAIVEKNNTKDFDGSGVPRAEVISKALGFDVVRSEVADVYQLYLQASAGEEDFPLHPAAPNIQRVLDAGSKVELVELADEFGVPKDKATGLTVKDLRKLLLVKFNGTAG